MATLVIVGRVLRLGLLLISVAAAGWGLPGAAFAANTDPICAVVKIEIEQVLTLERQAFDARMAITNHLDTISLENVAVSVIFRDEDGNSVPASYNPDDTSASFFIRVDSKDGVDDVDGNGTIAPGATAEIHWLIIPAPGAGGEVVEGKRYDVSAILSYTQNGEPEEITVAPDLIFVKPLPRLTLDYFLTRDVVADDAFTTEIESPEPFVLGVRVSNSGAGPAHDLKIDTAQPEIVENEQGLLIDFMITGAWVDNDAVEPELLLDFGEIGAGESRVGRWRMETNLSGVFTEFTAEFSHADELGGELTSLIDAANTHFLIHDILVDLPGRDQVADFLALDGDVLRVYESDGLDHAVLDQSAAASLVRAGSDRYTLSMPFTPGFGYAQMVDPYAGTRRIVASYRSDGKSIASENVWLSKTRVSDGPWTHHLNLIDVDTADTYTVVFGDMASGNQRPVLQFIDDKTVAVGNRLSFLVEASDADGTPPSLNASPLPSGASFTHEADVGSLARYVFDWTPASGQNGRYLLRIAATDGQLESSRIVVIRVTSPEDTDGDGMDDAWEMTHFGTLARDGTKDLDEDGRSDLDEFRENTDPNSTGATGTPVIDAPMDGEHVASLTPEMRVLNSHHGADVTVSYQFELYTDEELTDKLAEATVPEQQESTAWTPDISLEDNQWHYWRVRGCGDKQCSDWVYARFFVNVSNDPPGPFHLSSPRDGAEVGTLQPELAVTNSSDPDGDVVSYRFELHQDSLDGMLEASADNVEEGTGGTTTWRVPMSLDDGSQYAWRAIASDPHGATRESEETGIFLVNTLNSPPGEPGILSPADGATVGQDALELQVANSSDPDTPDLTYLFELDTVDTFDSPARKSSSLISGGADGTTSWHVDGLIENQWHYWRVRADDGAAQGAWVYGSFLVDARNDPPAVPSARNPSDGAWVKTRRPLLSVNAVDDPDGDRVSYNFEVSVENGFSALAAAVATSSTDWTVDVDLEDNTLYYWRVQSRDQQGLVSGWSQSQAFFVNDNGVDDPPSLQLNQPGEDITVLDGAVRIAWEDADVDSSASIGLYYEFSGRGTGGVPIVGGLPEDPDGDEADTYLWDITGLAPGDYHIYGLIQDATGQAVSYAPGIVTVGSLRQGSISVDPQILADTSETGARAFLSVVLDLEPTADVVIPLQSGDPTEGTVSPQSLTFTPANWSEPQTATVTGVNDCAPDGDVGYEILVGPAASDDAAYDGITLDNLPVVNLDDDPSSGHPTLHTCNYTLVRQERVSRVEFDYEYQVQLTNSGADVVGFTATVTSTSPHTKIIDGEVTFGPVRAGETVISLDTFTLRQNRRYPYDPAALQWTMQ